MPELAAPPPQSVTPELLYLVSSDPAELAEIVAPLRGADLAEALNQMAPDGAARVLANLPFDVAVDVLNQPQLEHREAVVQKMDRTTAGALISSMSPDRRVELLRELPVKKRNKVLSTIDDPARGVLQKLLSYMPHTAGGLMTTELVSVHAGATVAEARERIRDFVNARAMVYAVYVTDAADGKLLRAIALQDLVLVDAAEQIMNVGDRRPPLSARADTNQDEVARTISKYDLLALPVVDNAGRLLGIATVDDVIDAMVRETTEDVQKFGGLEALDKPYLRVSFGGMVKKRAGWLAALFLGEMLTATAMAHFEGEIARLVVLSLFIPLIISSGGNSGSQATSLIIRALALREISLGDWWKVALRELPTGLTLGAILGVIGVIRIFVWNQVGWYHYGPDVGLIAITIGLSLLGVVTFGSMAGSMLPFLLKRLGFDPASASAPFVATLVDVTGLIIYFTVALVVLHAQLAAR
ncbi:MAG: magnesium transporter [Gemmatimonadaceae bacterium]